MQLFHFWSCDVHQVQICCCVQNFMKIQWFFTDIWRYIYRFSKWRPSTIFELFHHHTRPPMKSWLLAAAACQISCQCDTQIWRYSYLNFLHIWLEMPIQAPKMVVLGALDAKMWLFIIKTPKRHVCPCVNPHILSYQKSVEGSDL